MTTLKKNQIYLLIMHASVRALKKPNKSAMQRFIAQSLDAAAYCMMRDVAKQFGRDYPDFYKVD